MQLTECFYINRNNNKDKFEQLEKWMKVSNNLYNQALYIVKKAYKEEKRTLRYCDIDKIMKNTKNLDGEINYRLMPSASASQQILRLLDKNINAFFRSLSDYDKNKNKYKHRPRFPNFRQKDSKFVLIFTNQQAKIKGNIIQLRKDFCLFIPTNSLCFDIKSLNCVRVIHINRNRIKIELIYTIKDTEVKEDNGKILGIDLGLDNFATCVSNTNTRPFILSGKELKSYNHFYNKKKAKLQSLLPKGLYNSNQLEELEFNRYCFIQDILHLYSTRIVEFCLNNNINTIVIGRNKEWKQKINLGKRNNQNFVSIPYYRFIQILKYKCKLAGVNFIETEESYTSKIDHLAKESMKHKDSYLGKRIRRGLFQSSKGKLINADANGAVGIIRKVFDDSKVTEIVNRGLLYRPLRIGFCRIKRNRNNLLLL